MWPVAIELVRPPDDGKPQWKQAFTLCWDSTEAWLWKLAKVLFLSHDDGIHQLYSHWLKWIKIKVKKQNVDSSTKRSKLFKSQTNVNRIQRQSLRRSLHQREIIQNVILAKKERVWR
uniref:Linoleate 13S-lipoxygenase 2-1, chloroplastic-like n=1 Tax=Tanacetum cinerariifolium TaxID=118510 RepID=A0A6L2MYG7_TANCI|nr:linoleate 13S-lipoxygenase 2-1, chloroplastic-like [Tanacetum cinerariifolium]